jgi:hypothetical protein
MSDIKKQIREDYGYGVEQSDIDKFLEEHAKAIGSFYVEMGKPWNIFIPISRVSYALLTSFLKNRDKLQSLDPDFRSQDEWLDTVEKMKRAFEVILLEEDDGDFLATKKDYEDVAEGLQLFGKYLRSLWD